jgi:hypothetical protein
MQGHLHLDQEQYYPSILLQRCTTHGLIFHAATGDFPAYQSFKAVVYLAAASIQDNSQHYLERLFKLYYIWLLNRRDNYGSYAR